MPNGRCSERTGLCVEQESDTTVLSLAAETP
jgi:hypothetical protein